jgi:hypothetical protein
MTVREWYEGAILGKHHSLILLVEFLVYEKKALTFEDSTGKLQYFLEDRFAAKMNAYLSDYEEKRRSSQK